MNIPWTERRVLVTGATGIVGSWLVKGLVDAGAYVAANEQVQAWSRGVAGLTRIRSARGCSRK